MTTTTQTTKCQTWCNRHLTEHDSGETVEVCRASISVRGVTVNLETSPSWGPDHRPIVPPDVDDLTAEGARALSSALGLAASIIEGNHNADQLVDH